MNEARFHFTQEDRQLALDALAVLVEYNAPDYALPVIASARRKLEACSPSITGREIGMICAGLQMLLDENALGYRANRLLTRLQGMKPANPSRK